MIKRFYSTKKNEYAVTSKKLLMDIENVLGIKPLNLIEFVRYDIEGLEDDFHDITRDTIFSEAPLDLIYEENMPELLDYKFFIVEFLPGQYDQRADSASQCIQLLSKGKRPITRCATLYALSGVSEQELIRIKNFIINPVESREGIMEKPLSLVQTMDIPKDILALEGFILKTQEDLKQYYDNSSFAMSFEDLVFVKSYFASEKRDPTLTELKVIDTYWSDHCRHTTFSTELKSVEIISDNPHIKMAYDLYIDLFNKHNSKRKEKYHCLMDIATIAVKELRAEGFLNNLDISDEINACSVEVDVDNDGAYEKWLIMFKNETHNHPTEIEPFGGAATCLGGAIRDPLSGRVYVYQAMRVTGAGDPRESFDKTIKGKLPQRVISSKAAAGYSSYGNQIGLATGLVYEIYNDKYKAKRLETGYVIGGAPKANVVRQKPKAGDIVLLLGGATGRDGCGGATGSSKAHDDKSIESCGAEVQKGNPLTERKIQRLFKNKEAANLIIKCNDFGAGGVSVAIGELSDSIDIFLDNVPKKYDGLDGTELAISESQERMAVVIEKENIEKFIKLAESENLDAVEVAKITKIGRMRMFWREKIIVDIKRDFLNTNGVKQSIDVKIVDNVESYIPKENLEIMELSKTDVKKAILKDLSRLNVCSKKGLGEMFDSTIGRASVLMPFGGKHQLTASLIMAAKPPVKGYTDTVTASSFGCPSSLLEISPFVGSIYSIVLSINKLIVAGIPASTIRLSLQEFFKRLRDDSLRWGEPLSALLGALYTEINLNIGAIGGKDSMSGSFNEIDVPPTLISFAMGIGKASKLITNVFKQGQKIYRLPLKRDNDFVPDFKYLKKIYALINANIEMDNIHSATIVENDIMTALINSLIGEELGFSFAKIEEKMFKPYLGDFILAIDDISEFNTIKYEYLGVVDGSGRLKGSDFEITHRELIDAYTSPLEKVFKSKTDIYAEKVENLSYNVNTTYKAKNLITKPKIFIPVFPGTNCEYDTAKSFEIAGGEPNIVIVKNRSARDIEETIEIFSKAIAESQIIAFPGGFSGGDEPEGSGKFIATTFRNPIIRDAVLDMLYKRDGLILGICNGFQALIKLGLVPYGDIKKQIETSPTLTFNDIARHVSTISQIRVASNKSPWLSGVKVGDIFNVAISHGEGKFVSGSKELKDIIDNGQIATQYVDLTVNATMISPYNPNGSAMAIEGIISLDGRVMGKMGHAERIGKDLYKNVAGEYDMKIFESGVRYFK